ncbi:histone H2B.3 [Bombina bombina]|uniref:histone H2B.3 n=1 Tax=Bombina bombina TaxID=8345 RepID=UPI00235A668A|nr:histone H2B.3 [Bombina bombina]
MAETIVFGRVVLASNMKQTVVTKSGSTFLHKRTLGVIGKAKKGHAKHLYRNIKQGHPDMTKYQWAVDFLKGTLKANDLAKVGSEAARLSHFNTRKAITSCEIQSALEQLYPKRSNTFGFIER